MLKIMLTALVTPSVLHTSKLNLKVQPHQELNSTTYSAEETRAVFCNVYVTALTFLTEKNKISQDLFECNEMYVSLSYWCFRKKRQLEVSVNIIVAGWADSCSVEDDEHEAPHDGLHWNHGGPSVEPFYPLVVPYLHAIFVESFFGVDHYSPSSGDLDWIGGQF
jgi:hypothetical protein